MGNLLPWAAATAAGGKDAFPSQRGSSWVTQLYPGSSGCCRNKLRSPGGYCKAPPHPTELLCFLPPSPVLYSFLLPSRAKPALPGTTRSGALSQTRWPLPRR